MLCASILVVFIVLGKPLLQSFSLMIYLWSPGNSRHPSAIFVDEVSASVQDPSVMERHQCVSGSGGCVFSVLTVCVLQRGELVLS